MSGNIEDQLELKTPYVTPEGPVQEQKYVIPVRGYKDANPGVYWVQRDDGKWTATSYRAPNGKKEVPNVGSDQHPWPGVGEVSDKIDMNKDAYKPDGYKDASDNTRHSKLVTNAHIAKTETIPTYQGRNSDITELEVKDLYFISITSETGEVTPGESGTGLYREEYNDQQEVNGKLSTRPNGYPKKTAMYLTPLNLEWRGTIVEKKKILATGVQQMEVGQEAQFKGEVATQAPGETAYGDLVDVTQRPGQTEWSSDNNGVASVNPETGLVKAVNPGIAKITVQWKNETYWLTDTVAVAVGGVPLPEEPEEPAVVCTPPQSAGVKTGSLLNSSAVGKIKADTRGSEKFEVSKGIPTSESLYGNVLAKEYLYNNKFEKFTGTCTFTVPVSKTYKLKWTEKEDYENSKGETKSRDVNKSRSVTVTPSYDIIRHYSYWTIPGLQVFKIDNAKLYNYAFQGNGIVIEPGSSYNVPTMDVETEVVNLLEPSPVSASAPSETIDGGSSEPDVPDEDLESYAEEETPELDVRNDKLIFNGETVMDGSMVKTKTKDPGAIKTPLSIDENALYRPENVIPVSKTNKADNESTGTIEYSPLDGSLGNPEKMRQPIDDLNNVTVHTPVVMYPSVTNDKEHNQKVYPTAGTAALVLDRPFTVTIPTSGPHRDIKGYGNRDYAKYTAYKQVLFEFDVYNEDMGKYIPANTWIDIPITQLETTFRMPVWVNEGKYTVHFRSIAENAPESFTWESMANLNLVNHVAVNTIPVEVIGRLYDFKVTDIVDYDWETVFRTKKGSSEPTGAAYWVGPHSLDGTARGNTPPFILPILPGSHPNEGYKNVAIKTGYHFKFDFKTKGNMFGPKDHVKVVPTFYFVSKDGAKRQKVDLYYHNQTTGQKFVKIGSSQDTVTRSMVLNSRMRNVPSTELTNTAKYVATYGFTDFMKQAGKKNTIGSYGLLDLAQRVRTLIGPTANVPKSVDPGRAVASMQKWYGEV
ncbi:DUF5704 domain-containing protein [Paenibacillus sp. P96]|uniref:DUF5704 domain-containing protein n=1 Tax=Paenibacillus zeirhizosphaerae TaxID=2987519 RepID=A0ABT9FVV6_9BACL|nr:DUF5704 domain-containing protein [Paenibacillus sp. P96]MDP4098866.1 DUF5704 domain-containing protein [Paenibacillus sp. P96]